MQAVPSDTVYGIIMPDAEKIREVIQDIASRPSNVLFSEIDWVFRQLVPYYPGRFSCRVARHGTLFQLGGRRFMMSRHHPGTKQVKSYAVEDFLDAMSDLGWYKE